MAARRCARGWDVRMAGLRMTGRRGARRQTLPVVAVSGTATAISRVRVAAWRMDSSQLELASRHTPHGLLRRTAFAIHLLHCICRPMLRQLPRAAGRRLRWLNKRFQANYTISLSSVKPQPLVVRKRSYGGCESTITGARAVWRGPSERVKRREDAFPSPFGSTHNACSPTAKCLTSHDVEGFSRSALRERRSGACDVLRARKRCRRSR